MFSGGLNEFESLRLLNVWRCHLHAVVIVMTFLLVMLVMET